MRPDIRPPNLKDWLLHNKSEEFAITPTRVLGRDAIELVLSGSRVLWGPAVFSLDQDQSLRRFPRAMFLAANPSDAEDVLWAPTWARVIADKYLVKEKLTGDEVFLSVASKPPDHKPVLEYFSCSGGDVTLSDIKLGELNSLARQKPIVLLGGTFYDSRDFYTTSESYKNQGQQTAGVFINARAVAAELAGSAPRELKQPFSMIMDLAGAWIIVLFVSFLKKAENPKVMMVTTLITAVGFIAVLAISGYMFSLAAVIVVTVAQQFIDFWRSKLTLVKDTAPPPHRD